MSRTVASLIGIGVGVAASRYSQGMNKKSMKKFQKRLRKMVK